MLKRRLLLGLVVALAIPATALATLFSAGAAPAEQAAPALDVTMSGTIGSGGRNITYTITLTNNSSSDVRDVYVTGTIPEGTRQASATETPKDATFLGEEDGAAAWVSPLIPASAKQTFSYRVNAAEGQIGSAHAWIRWTDPTEGEATSSDVTWDQAVAAGAPNRGCQSCHKLRDATTGGVTLAYEGFVRVKARSGGQHPTVAPDGTSIKPTDQTGPEPCLQCHRPGTGEREGMGVIAPMALRDIVHPAHMTSEPFIQTYKGNCFTCHNVQGDGTFVLLGQKVDVTEKGIPKSLQQGTGVIPGAIPPSEGGR